MSSVAKSRVVVDRNPGYVPLPSILGRSPKQVGRHGVRVGMRCGPAGFTFRWSSCSWDGVAQVRDPVIDRERSAKRAQGALRDRIITGGLRIMFTFTHRENVTELAVSRACVSRFLRLARRKWPGFKWAGAAERQKRGAWHWHVAVNGYYDINVVRDLWLRATGQALFGNVNVKAFDASVRAARYLAKYLAKTFVEEAERPRYGHHYVVARGLRPEVRDYLLLGTTQGDLLTFVEEQARELGFTTRAWSSADRWRGSGGGWGCA